MLSRYSLIKNNLSLQTLKELAPAIKGSLEWSVSSNMQQNVESESDTDSDGPNDDHWLGFL